MGNESSAPVQAGSHETVPSLFKFLSCKWQKPACSSLSCHVRKTDCKCPGLIHRLPQDFSKELESGVRILGPQEHSLFPLPQLWFNVRPLPPPPSRRSVDSGLWPLQGDSMFLKFIAVLVATLKGTGLVLLPGRDVIGLVRGGSWLLIQPAETEWLESYSKHHRPLEFGLPGSKGCQPLSTSGYRPKDKAFSLPIISHNRWY